MNPVLTSILIKPAGPDCSMDCGYCFYSGKSALYPEPGAHRMSEEVLEQVMRGFLGQTAGDLSIGWQGESLP